MEAIVMPTGWKITSQTQTLDIGPDGRGHDALTVEYANDAGTVNGRIVVPLDADTADTFKQAFAERVAMHDQIGTA